VKRFLIPLLAALTLPTPVNANEKLLPEMNDIEANKINYIDKPYTRFEGTEFEQNTFFIEDPNGNVLELKTFD